MLHFVGCNLEMGKSYLYKATDLFSLGTLPSVTGCLLPTVTRPRCGHIFEVPKSNNPTRCRGVGQQISNDEA